MSKEFDDAVEKHVDAVLAGNVRNTSAPVAEIREPEPSSHPDERMRLTIKDPALRLKT